MLGGLATGGFIVVTVLATGVATPSLAPGMASLAAVATAGCKPHSFSLKEGLSENLQKIPHQGFTLNLEESLNQLFERH